jgi:3-methyladenine DNA glycosylase AlkD
MDAFSANPNQWLRRVAILHQLRYRDSTDAERLFGYALENASHPSFWIRRALGWALREYAKTDAGLEFVEQNDGDFSTLTVREALKRFDCFDKSQSRATISATDIWRRDE